LLKGTPYEPFGVFKRGIIIQPGEPLSQIHSILIC
jgi:hypothetical protein